MKILIDSKWIDKDDKIGVYDPFDNSLIDLIPKANREDVNNVLKAAEKGCKIAKNLTIYERSQILYKTADILTNRTEEFAQLLARESSKTIREARKEVSRCVNTLRVSGEETKRIHGETIAFDSFPGGENRKGYYYRFPIGIILAITPFNDPLNLVAHKLGPAFAGGNSVILKPATVTPLSAIKLAEALLEAGLPPQVLQIITGHGVEIGEPLIKDERIQMLSFTGGITAGKKIVSIAGIKKLGMELGSNSPVIVWCDCDIDWAVDSCVSGATLLCGGQRKDAFISPTVLENVPKNCRIYCEEVFGPVVNLFRIDDFDEAIKEANSLEYGLHAAVFTKDVNLAFKAAYEIECGGVMINDSTDYRLDSMPFGGVKNSGLGREGIKFALQEMTEPKVICFYHG
jgi:glyceraldehyde-3-phosphate dehydrogenase (NADP+)